MASAETAQIRLNRIVVEVASIMVAEVSSVYVRSKDGRLELFATKGLAANAVHETRLRWGEGLVGLVARQARTLNVSDAPSHPDFVLRPETHEEAFHTFVGVPLIRHGNVVGVLTVQNRKKVSYSPGDIEALETAAMFLAEMLATAEMTKVIDPVADILHDMPHILSCHPLSEGIALGTVFFHEARVVIPERVSENTPEQLWRLDHGLDELGRQLDQMLKRGDLARGGAHRDVLEAYRMFARDAGWQQRMREAVRTGLTAEAGVERVQNENRARLQSNPNPYLRERLSDLNDLSNRLLRVLAKQAGREQDVPQFPADAILVAKSLGPAELLDYDRAALKGLILEEGALAAHVAIVARALGIAAVGGADGVLDLAQPGDKAVVDAQTGEAYIRPRPDVIEAFEEKLSFQKQRVARYKSLRGREAVTRDGVPIKLMMNAGLLVDLPQLSDSGADGIGLFRTELQFMVSAKFPQQSRQQKIYKAVLDAADDKPVVFRTLDVGGDKLLPYLRHEKEQNPALGWRAIRMSLDRPALFRPQIRALLRAAAGRELRIMLPMVTCISEYDKARLSLEAEKKFLRDRGHELPLRVKLGAMIEVPALLWQLDLLLPRVDFVSVGTNDLLQFLFAADRQNPLVGQRFDPLGPSALRVLRHIVDTSAAHNVPLTLCGEMAGDPLQAMALLGLGFRTISMAPASIGPIKEMVMALDIGVLEQKLLDYLRAPDGEIKAVLTAQADSLVL